MTRRSAAAALAAVLALASAPVLAQDPPKPPVPPAPASADAAARKETKVRRLLELQRFKDFFFAGFDATIEQQVRAGMLPKEFPAKFKEVADLEGLEKIAVDIWSEAVDEPTLDAAIAFYETEAGRKFVEAGLAVTSGIMKKVEPWAMENAMKTMKAISGQPMEEDGDDAAGDADPLTALKKAKLSANETSAIATLRNLTSCQAQIQTSGKIDCDRDGIGEYGTFLELTGSAGVRLGFSEGKADFSKQGTKVNPPILSPKLAGVDASGVVRKNGYCYRIFLPDAAAPSSRFTHESGPADKVGLAGGTTSVLVDLAEMTWCAYAWPEKIGETGNRAFFTNQYGDVMQSSNDAAKWEGEKSPQGNAAFLGDGITAPQAIGTRARDGDVWKVVD